MTRDLTVDALYARHAEGLELEWISGRSGGGQVLRTEESTNWPANLVGHMNLLRPHQVQVIGRSEHKHLETLAAADADSISARLFEAKPALIIVADGLRAPKPIMAGATEAGTPVLTSRVASDTVVQALQHDLARRFARRHVVHGVLIEVMGVGVLITGESGVGKSELALELISRGHRLVADDSPEFYLTAPGILEGCCPPELQDFMEVRGLGIFNVRELFGDGSVKRDRNLGLIVRLLVLDEPGLSAEERLEGIRRMRKILDVPVPEYTLPVAPGRNLAVLVECTVRNHLLLKKGYDAAHQFAERQNRLMHGDVGEKDKS
ncbi:MAG: HPr(Ser) kinase/phosphatase [Gammaproteobacteria bacterium]|nr:HPr(Ser) kinase/phosphatase [Gammaproteobacteria bacterium]